MKPTIYHCKTRTEAIDRSNLLYISSAATQIQRDEERREITLTTRTGREIAVFQY